MQTQERYEYAGFWARVGATLLDQILIFLIVAYPLYAVYGEDYFSPPEGAPFCFIQGWVDFILSWVFPAIATLVFWRFCSSTPGKMAIRAKIVDARSGNKPTMSQLVIRYLGYFLSVLPIGIGCMWVGWDKRKQGWHDKLAGTVVIRECFRGPTPVEFDRTFPPEMPSK